MGSEFQGTYFCHKHDNGYRGNQRVKCEDDQGHQGYRWHVLIVFMLLCWPLLLLFFEVAVRLSSIPSALLEFFALDSEKKKRMAFPPCFLFWSRIPLLVVASKLCCVATSPPHHPPPYPSYQGYHHHQRQQYHNWQICSAVPSIPWWSYLLLVLIQCWHIHFHNNFPCYIFT